MDWFTGENEQLDMAGNFFPGAHAAVVGGGFLGTEVALALASRGFSVSQVYAEPAPLFSELPAYLSQDVQRRLIKAGVTPMPERLVTGVRVSCLVSSRLSMPTFWLFRC